MDGKLSRREFFGTTPTACGAVALFGLAGANDSIAGESATATGVGGRSSASSAEFPRQEYEVVGEVVGASHFRFARVKELVSARPALAKASWDWGFGDWETALGAASHTGQREIAEFLMEHGARPDIFTFAMLGKLAAVRSLVEAVPGIQRTPGPHGITLLQHARNRLRSKRLSAGDRAGVQSVLSYLESLGDADIGPTSLELTEDQRETFIGCYAFGSGPEDTLTIALDRRNRLTVQRGARTARRLHRVETHAFAPSGAPDVRLRFDVKDARAVTLTIHDPMPLVRATRDNC